MIGVPRPSPFFMPLPCIILNKNRRTKKRGRPGNEANGQIDGYGNGHHMTRKVVSHIYTAEYMVARFASAVQTFR